MQILPGKKPYTFLLGHIFSPQDLDRDDKLKSYLLKSLFLITITRICITVGVKVFFQSYTYKKFYFEAKIYQSKSNISNKMGIKIKVFLSKFECIILACCLEKKNE